MSSLSTLTSAQLIKAAKLKDRIAKLEKQLNSLLGASSPVKTAKAAAQAPKKRTMSAAGKARIAAAQRARWAKVKAAKKAAK